MSRIARQLVEDGVQAAVHCAAPVARRIRFALSEKQMEREVSTLRRELDETRAALRLQTTRCRQLVAAYSARLKERDAQLAAGSALRDHQLALVLRALLALEARLRREQQAIRTQLTQRDAVIHQQQMEISKLRALATAHTAARRAAPPGIGAAATPSELIVVNHTCGKDAPCQDPSSGPQPAAPSTTRSSKRRSKPRPTPTAGSHDTVVDASHHLRHQEAALRVLELVGPNKIGPGAPMPLLNGETASIVDAGIDPPADFIEDSMTPPPDVIASYNDMNRECIELANMAASLRGSCDGNPPSRDARFQDNPVLECVNLILLRDPDDYQESRRCVDAASPTPLSQPESLEPRAWYDSKEKESAAPAQLHNPDRKAKCATPPALPPKPPRLVPTRHSPPTKARPAPATRTIITAKEGHLNSDTAPGEMNSKIISNGSGAFNLVKKNRPDTLPRPSNFPLSVQVYHSPGDTSTPPAEAPASPKKPKSSGRIGSSVTTLIMNGSSENMVKESVDGASPDSKPDEDASDALRRNFEEFNLDDCDIEGLGEDVLHEGRPDGDGAECRVSGIVHQDILTLAPPANYDTFLEATGLSNKSILTPSRMLSNHRSVLKPKDVKHRSRVKAGERCLTTGPTTKYWMEPFL